MASLFRVKAALLVAAVAATLGLSITPLSAQTTGTIRGRVVEAGTLRPLSGVQVSVPGTGRGALTNAAGDYLLVGVPTGSRTVRAQLIGYANLEQAVTVGEGEAASVDFQLSQSAIALDEIIVTGTAGATQKRAIGNAVTTVQAENITDRAPISNVTQLLQARAPGLSINPGAGTSGTAAQIRIRGQGSVAGAQIPVFIIDGVRINNVQNGWAVSGQSRNPLDFINPDDIESIEVIKGPAAATLYGAEAANGVIQIITKKGRRGQQGIQWNAKAEYGQIDWTIDTPTNYTLCTNARIRNAPRGNLGDYVGCAPVDSMLPANSMDRLISHNPLRDDPNTLRTGEVTDYTLSARGGGDRYSFFVSGNLLNESGVFYNNDTGRRAGRANFTVAATDQLDFSVNASYTRTNSRLPLNDNASNGLLRNAFRGLPGQQGNYAVGWRGLSPAEVNMYNNQARSDRFVLGATSNYSPFSWFQNRLTLGVDHNATVATNFYEIWRGTAPSPYGADVANGAIYQFTPERRSYTLDYSGTISNTLPWYGASSAFSFGTQLNARRYEFTRGEGEGLISNDVRLINTAAITRAASNQEEQTSLGFFVQEQLGFANRLFITGALRVDDNSAFGSDFSTVVYPKLSASYVISEEPFFNLPMVDNLRLRAAWGQAGNSPEPFSADRNYGGAAMIDASGAVVSALRSTAYGNPNLKAETGSEVELGLESSLLNGRAGVDFTYYNKRTFDALLPIPVPPSSGFGGGALGAGSTAAYRTRLENAGEIANSGIELSLWGTPVVRRNFEWETRLGVSTNRNEMVDLGGLEPQLRGNFATTQWIREGYPLGSYFGVRVARNPDGTIQKDANGRGILSSDTVYIGPSTPTRELALSNTVT
ncbi:MAG: SusC/RagA family TonB-linked outer membrane protein, partial [Gemmatimonadota bacterium]|nr:SusC/RagA family TonB-linked outer membrane protein [Gemmatimonadota bacterium]